MAPRKTTKKTGGCFFPQYEDSNKGVKGTRRGLMDSIGSIAGGSIRKNTRKRGRGFGPSDSTVDRVNDAISNGINNGVTGLASKLGNAASSFFAKSLGEKAANLFNKKVRKQTDYTTNTYNADGSGIHKIQKGGGWFNNPFVNGAFNIDQGGAIHCLKCRKHTSNRRVTLHTTQKGGSMIKTNCSDCGTRKCRFVKKGDGFSFGDFTSGIGKAVEVSTPYVQAAQPYLQAAATVAPLLL